MKAATYHEGWNLMLNEGDRYVVANASGSVVDAGTVRSGEVLNHKAEAIAPTNGRLLVPIHDDAAWQRVTQHFNH